MISYTYNYLYIYICTHTHIPNYLTYIPMIFPMNLYHILPSQKTHGASFSTSQRDPPPRTTPPSPTAAVGRVPRRGAGARQLPRSRRARSRSSGGRTLDICQNLMGFWWEISPEVHFWLRKNLLLRNFLGSPSLEDESHSIQFDPIELDATAAVAVAAQSRSFAVANVVATSCA